jgi:hypothetical protein
MVEVLLDGGFKFGHTLEDPASDAIGSDATEEALDLVEPRRRCRGDPPWSFSYACQECAAAFGGRPHPKTFAEAAINPLLV